LAANASSMSIGCPSDLLGYDDSGGRFRCSLQGMD